MKKRELIQWERNQYFQGLLLFAQTLEESTFHYSYDSYKLPALNSHFLCYDILYTINDINKKILMDGNFVPLAEEFEQMLQSDLFLKNVVDPQGTLLYSKTKNGQFANLATEDNKSKIRTYSEVAKYIISISEMSNNYLADILNQITENIFRESFSQENAEAVYNLTRALVTDLVNSHYSKEYIYSVVLEMFFNPKHTVLCTADTVVEFFNRFTFEENHYQVIFGINKKGADIFKKLNEFIVRDPTLEESRALKMKMKNCIVAEVTALDAHSAFENAARRINTYISLHQINQHISNIEFTSFAYVVQNTNEPQPTRGIVIRSSINPIEKQGNSSDLHALIDDVVLTKHVKLPTSFYRATALHSSAIGNKEITNQLLNLWTIVEVLIETKRDNEDKINTICSILSAVLNRCYIYSCIEKLYKDIKSCAENRIDALLSKVEAGSGDLDMVEKLALLLSIGEYVDLREELITSLSEYPLLIFRLKKFSQAVFRDSKSIIDFLNKHEKRIKWHIMRIYRNRNMIVHNGSSLPYRTIIVENLHYYVDTLLDTLIEYYCIGIREHSSIFKHIMHEQVNHYRLLGAPVAKNEKQQIVQLTKENALQLIFNGYSGNLIKKTVEKVLEDNKKKFSETKTLPLVSAT